VTLRRISKKRERRGEIPFTLMTRRGGIEERKMIIHHGTARTIDGGKLVEKRSVFLGVKEEKVYVSL